MIFMKYMEDVILTRRSIRKYKPLKIEREKILQILNAAMYAPSAVNKQPWHFIVVDEGCDVEDHGDPSKFKNA